MARVRSRGAAPEDSNFARHGTPPRNRDGSCWALMPHGPTKSAVSEREDPHLGARVQSARAARLMDLLGLSEDELCALLDVDALTLLSGQLDHRAELPILLGLLDEAQERAGAAVLRRWVRAPGPGG